MTAIMNINCQGLAGHSQKTMMCAQGVNQGEATREKDIHSVSKRIIDGMDKRQRSFYDNITN